MATITGSFTGPGASGSVPYAAGAAVAWAIDGAWRKAIVNTEISADGGATWVTEWVDFGINGLPVSTKGYPPGAGLFRLRCTYFDSGSLQWSITA